MPERIETSCSSPMQYTSTSLFHFDMLLEANLTLLSSCWHLESELGMQKCSVLDVTNLFQSFFFSLLFSKPFVQLHVLVTFYPKRKNYRRNPNNKNPFVQCYVMPGMVLHNQGVVSALIFPSQLVALFHLGWDSKCLLYHSSQHSLIHSNQTIHTWTPCQYYNTSQTTADQFPETSEATLYPTSICTVCNEDVQAHNQGLWQASP